jgi:DNA-directed RNA polymerase beta' subunit
MSFKGSTLGFFPPRISRSTTRGKKVEENKPEPIDTSRSTQASRPLGTKRNASTKRDEDVMRIQSVIMGDVDDKKKSVTTTTPLLPKTPTLTAAMRSCLLRRVEGYVNALEEDFPEHLYTNTLSADRIRKSAVVEVDDPSLEPNAPKGVNSLAMGTVTVNSRCGTCCQAQAQCPAHSGYINLNTYITLPQFERVIIAIFNSTCPCCSWVPFTRESLSLTAVEKQAVLGMTGWNYLSTLEKYSKGVQCRGNRFSTDREIYDCKKDKLPIADLTASKGKNSITTKDGRVYSATELYNIFNNISETGARILGFSEGSHPRDLITDVLELPPPATRPPLYEGSIPSHDPLTLKYQKIVKLAQAIQNSPENVGKYDEQIREAIRCIVVEDKKGKRGGGSSTPYSILLRFKGKEGQFRGAVHGKRTDYTARGVLSPASYIRFGEMVIPQSVASIWAIEEMVTQANTEYIRKLLLAGMLLTHTPSVGKDKDNTVKIIPGAKIVIHLGDTVTRWTETGDLMVFNRQPSLHNLSYLGYTAVVIDDREIIGLHPSCTPPHNADFDGDTGMIGIPLSAASRAEVAQLLHITKNLMDTSQNKPSVGLIMDTITNAYLLTDPGEGMEPYIFSQIYNTMENPPPLGELQTRAQAYGLHPWSGRTLFSALFPSGFYYDMPDFHIIDGILVNGRSKGNHIGTSHRSVIQDLYHQYGEDVTVNFITNGTWLLIAWGNIFGFSVGIADCEYGREAGDIKEALISKIEEEIEALGPRPREPILAAAYEQRIRAIIDQVKPLGKSMAFKYMGPSCPLKGRQNAIGCMAKEIGSGAKSDLFNIAQMAGSVGPQFFADQRMIPTMNDGRRSLPTQPKRPVDKEGPVTERGFVASSYVSGMSPEELYSILRGGLQGQIDTNLSTADVGAMQRLAAMAGLNIAIRKQGEIATSTGLIYSFMYGGDSLEPRELLSVKIPGGTVPSFCDLGMIIEQVNAESGWVKSEIIDWIEENKENAKVININIEKRRREQIITPTTYQEFLNTPTLVRPSGYQRVDKSDVSIIDLIKDSPIPVPEPSVPMEHEISFKRYSLPKKLITTPIYTPTFRSDTIEEDFTSDIPPISSQFSDGFGESEVGVPVDLDMIGDDDMDDTGEDVIDFEDLMSLLN